MRRGDAIHGLGAADLAMQRWIGDARRGAAAEGGGWLPAPLGGPIRVGGGAGLPGEPLNFEALVNRADHALYQAKGTGRNAVYSADGNNLSLFASE